jgi:phosphoglycerol transferase MdoB-like AlkP superfamily enzyme
VAQRFHPEVPGKTGSGPRLLFGERGGTSVTNKNSTSWTSSIAAAGRGQRAHFELAEAHIASWALAFLLVFGTLKAVAIIWFLSHGVDPFSDYPAWRIPLLLAGDITASCGVGFLAGLLSSASYRSRVTRGLATALRWLIAITIVTIASINLRIIEVYRAVLDRYLMLKVGNPAVMKESIVANMDATFISSMVFGLAVVAFLPGMLRKRFPSLSVARSFAFFAMVGALALLPLVAARSLLSGRETFGLKHNAVLALAFSPPEIFQFADPRESYRRLSAALPNGPELKRLVEWSPKAERVTGHPELAGSFEGYNVVLLLLESVAAKHVSGATMPTMYGLEQASLRYLSHRTTAVNTFDAHYSIFRSMPVRGDGFEMRKLYGGYASDPSLMEVLSRAGYSVGLFHASFLNFIDTRWVWEAPGEDALIDGHQVISPSKPGWSWGANDADVAQAAVDWAASRKGQKFFMVFNPAGSHHPYLAPRTASPFPGDSCLPRYQSALYAVDQSIAVLLEGLKKSGLAERTVVVGVSDHGELIDVKENVCGHGMALVEDELNVPFFIHVPSGVGAGKVDRLETNHWDVAPTIASLVRLPAPEAWLGRNLLAEQVTRSPTFVGVNYRKHTAVVFDGAIGDLNLSNGRLTWSRPPTEQAKAFEPLLRTFDDRVGLHHASRVVAPKP